MLPVTSIEDIQITVCSSQAPAVGFEKKLGDVMSNKESLYGMDNNNAVSLDATGGSTLDSLASTGDCTVNSLASTGDCTVNSLASTGDCTVNSLASTGDSTVNSLASTGDSAINSLASTGDSSVNSLAATGDSKVNSLIVAGNDEAAQPATVNKILRQIHNMDELELKKYISELQRGIANVKQDNECLALQLKENEISCEEVSLQLGSMNEEMEIQRLVFNQKEMLLKEDLISKEQRIENLQSEIITHKEKSTNDMKVIQIQLDDTLKTSTELHERLQSVENKVLWKTKVVELVQKQIEKVATMHCDVEEKLLLKKRFWKKSSQSRKAKALQLLEGGRRMINRLQALFM